MPRKPRDEIEAGVWHVWARGNDRMRIYRDAQDCRTYLSELGAVVANRRWRCLGYCLMVNHVHLLVETVEPNLGGGMGRLHGHYARLHNRRHRRTGHLFGGRFGGNRVTTDEQLLWVARYIARNPVEAGLCEAPEQWRWGSHAAIVGGPVPAWLDVSRLAASFGGLRRYLEFVRRVEGPPDGMIPSDGGARHVLPDL